MTDPTSGDSPLALPLTDAEREARIEQLLVSGLDEYFAGRMDHAVNVWTRVLFLDRANDRARAYIDRARRAQAERQRESEALMHQGLQAFDEGDVDRARRLLTAAVERGAPHEQALPVLHRIGLLDVTAAAPPTSALGLRWRRADRPSASRTTSRLGPWLLAAAIAAIGAIAVYASLDRTPSTFATSAIDAGPVSLPVPGASEAHLFRARQLFDAGKLPDALRVLDRIDQGDSAYAEAQTLRGRVQRELLTATVQGRETSQP